MNTSSPKREAEAELASRDFEASTAENNQTEIYEAGLIKSPKFQPEKLDEIKTSLRKAIMSDLTKIIAENHNDVLKLFTLLLKKPVTLQNLENSDSEPENVVANTTSTPIKTKATTSKVTPVSSRNTFSFVKFFTLQHPKGKY